MTAEEIEEAYHKEMKERIFSHHKSEFQAPATARIIFLKYLEIAQREAVEKTLAYVRDAMAEHGLESYLDDITPEKVLGE